MHMADALMSPAVGTALWGSSAVAMAYSSKKVQSGLDDNKIPLMGVMGAFVFAAQMINFTIPMTGSSGHIGGGLLLSINLKVEVFGRGMAWLDTGTHEGLLEASNFVEAVQKRQGLYIACIEEIAYRMGYITKEQLEILANPLLKTDYGQYLMEIARGL